MPSDRRALGRNARRPDRSRLGACAAVAVAVTAVAAMAVATTTAAAGSRAARAARPRSALRGSQNRRPRKPPATPSSPSEWTVYHGAPDGAGVAPGVDLASPTRAWQSPRLDGAVYGEPLEAAGRVVVATEDDTVYALAADSGAVLWSTHLGEPVPSTDLPCGDIAPTVGVTGTPVVDVARSEVFVVADELDGGRPSHHLVGLDLYTGKVLLDRVVDPPGADTAALLQRTGLSLDRGRVLFGFGGNDGDCGPYHGWVTSVPVSGRGRIRRYETVTKPGDRQAQSGWAARPRK